MLMIIVLSSKDINWKVLKLYRVMLKSLGHESSLEGGAPSKCFGLSPFDDPGQHMSEINGESGGLEERTPLFFF